MKRVVFCWELGGNYGHITSFLPLYRELRALGLQVDFVLRDLTFAKKLMGDLSARCWQAPVMEVDALTEAYSYVDILAQIGYLNVDRLTSHVGKWREVLSERCADIIVANHAPSALLAARTLGIPATVFGSGFLIPPLVDPLPVFHIWNDIAEEKINRNSENVLTAINGALVHFNVEPLSAIYELFAVAERFLCTVPELDHYLERNEEDYWGPYFVYDIGIEPKWPSKQGPKIFAYLTARVKSLDLLLEQLSEVDGVKLVHIPSASPELLERYRSINMHIETEPLNMSAVLSSACLVIHQAGIGTSSACLFAGVRQLLLPTQLEQALTCKRLVSQGLAYGLDPNASGLNYAESIKLAMDCPIMERSLGKFKEKYRGFDQREQYSFISKVIVDLIDAQHKA